MGILTTGAGTTSTSTTGAGYVNMILDGRAVSDTDAAAFISAASISDSTQQTAIYFLVGALKDTGLWTKMTACYPFVGGNATAHSKDLKAAYNITWTATPTQNSNGVTFNGTTQYGDTGITPSAALSLNSAHISFYRRTFSAASSYDIGCLDGTTGCFILCRSSGLFRVALNNPQGTPDAVTLSPADLYGMFIGTRTSASVQSGYVKNRIRLPGTISSTSLVSTRSLYIGALNSSGTAASFSDGNYSFASVGSGLSATDAQNLSMIVQSYQTILGRAV